MSSNYGYQNEIDFVEHFDGKYFYELDDHSQCFLKDLFGNTIDNENIIHAWKNKSNQKADMFIKYNNCIRSISLKCGKSNSVHCESIQDFRKYLFMLGIPYDVVTKYIDYHYGYIKDIFGKIDFSKQLTADEYKVLYQDDIDQFNKYVNKTRIIIDMIGRFLIRGRNSEYDIDVLVSGRIDDYVWITKDDLYDLILSKRNINYSSPHIACMTIGPKKRCISGDKNIKDRYLICVRWNGIREDIISFYEKK